MAGPGRHRTGLGGTTVAEYPALHGPARPEWVCIACRDDWPCVTRKRQLRELFQDNDAGLVGYLAQYLVDATGDLEQLSTIEVTDRLVGWCIRPLR